MNILGIGGYSHDSAAALVCDGQLAAAVAEERLSRAKHQGGLPRRAVEWCLAQAGLTLAEVDHIGGYMRPGLRLVRRIPYRLGTAWRHPLYAAAYTGYEIIHNAQYVMDLRSLCGPSTRLHYLEHHPAHAASAFLCSPFDEAALLSIDYVGEWAATWRGVGRGATITRIQQTNYPNSLGVFYSALTDYLGFQRASDEYKVMGLASYGEPEYYDALSKVLRPGEDGAYRIDHRYTAWQYLPGSRRGYFSERFLREFGPRRAPGAPLDDRHRNLAASAQRLLEDIVLGLARRLHRETGSANLCLAGGVALNCAMNGRLQREGPFERIWVQPAAGDDGIAIGAALQLHHRLTGAGRAFRMEHAAWGPDADAGEIEHCLHITKTPHRRSDDIAADTARLLAEGLMVGWYQGRMEFGPRALGNRSILADPTRADMKDLLNTHVKFREEFRPFAPSVLAERAGEFFEGCAEAPFMQFVYPVRPEKRALLPAITHVDGTARVQTVTEAANPRFYRLIKAFEAIRGVPVVLNTSFNVMGEPIVHTPFDALKCFHGTGLDALAMGDYLVIKNP
ncbi:MAG: carbamoyltransferase [Candidatus Hydrogenedentes bacterium]|nr:carbamoyltransferase [Candidatus Hydrogenedentota bacterium]